MRGKHSPAAEAGGPALEGARVLARGGGHEGEEREEAEKGKPCVGEARRRSTLRRFGAGGEAGDRRQGLVVGAWAQKDGGFSSWLDCGGPYKWALERVREGSGIEASKVYGPDVGIAFGRSDESS